MRSWPLCGSWSSLLSSDLPRPCAKSPSLTVTSQWTPVSPIKTKVRATSAAHGAAALPLALQWLSTKSSITKVKPQTKSQLALDYSVKYNVPAACKDSHAHGSKKMSSFQSRASQPPRTDRGCLSSSMLRHCSQKKDEGDDDDEDDSSGSLRDTCCMTAGGGGTEFCEGSGFRVWVTRWSEAACFVGKINPHAEQRKHALRLAEGEGDGIASPGCLPPRKHSWRYCAPTVICMGKNVVSVFWTTLAHGTSMQALSQSIIARYLYLIATRKWATSSQGTKPVDRVIIPAVNQAIKNAPGSSSTDTRISHTFLFEEASLVSFPALASRRVLKPWRAFLQACHLTLCWAKDCCKKAAE